MLGDWKQISVVLHNPEVNRLISNIMSHPEPLHSNIYSSTASAHTPSWSKAYASWQGIFDPVSIRPSSPSGGRPQTLLDNIAQASAFESFKLFTSASRLLPQSLTHEAAIAKVISIVDEEVERLAEEKGLSAWERERAIYEAHKAVRGMYEEWYVRGLELGEFVPGRESKANTPHKNSPTDSFTNPPPSTWSRNSRPSPSTRRPSSPPRRSS